LIVKNSHFIFSDVDCSHEENQIGKGGLLINPKNPKEIASKIIKLLQNNNLRNKIIKNGFDQYKKFNDKKFIYNFKKFF